MFVSYFLDSWQNYAHFLLHTSLLLLHFIAVWISKAQKKLFPVYAKISHYMRIIHFIHDFTPLRCCWINQIRYNLCHCQINFSFFSNIYFQFILTVEWRHSLKLTLSERHSNMKINRYEATEYNIFPPSFLFSFIQVCICIVVRSKFFTIAWQLFVLFYCM